MTDSAKRRRQPVFDKTWRGTQVGLTQFLDVVTPWLLDLGSWIFGALIACNLVILGVVLTIGPVDDAVKVATAAFALALPPNVVGFVLLRLVADMRKIRLQETATQAFQQAGFQVEDMPDPQKAERHLSSVTLGYTYSLMALTFLLTLVGVTAALWHSAWWIGVAFLVMLVLSLGVMLAAASQLGGGRGRWQAPGGEIEPSREKKP